jgi:hypothetical protein
VVVAVAGRAEVGVVLVLMGKMGAGREEMLERREEGNKVVAMFLTTFIKEVLQYLQCSRRGLTLVRSSNGALSNRGRHDLYSRASCRCTCLI